jgi:hypothetical protein
VAHVPGAWRRVSSWQPAPIGVILGQVPLFPAHTHTHTHTHTQTHTHTTVCRLL